jgi:hypothetical protein
MNNELRRIWKWSWRILSYLTVCIGGSSKREQNLFRAESRNRDVTYEVTCCVVRDSYAYCDCIVGKFKWQIRNVSFIAIPSTAVVNGMSRRTQAFWARGHDRREREQDSCAQRTREDRNILSVMWFRYELNFEKRYMELWVKESRNSTGVAQRVPEGLGSQISWHSAREGGEVVSLTHRPPLSPGMFLVLIFTGGWVEPSAMVRSEGNM